MKNTSKAASVIALSLLVGSIGFAQGADAHGRGAAAKAPKTKVEAKREMKANPIASLAAMFGLSEADLNTLLQAKTGQSLSELTTLINGLTAQEIITKLTAYESAQIDAQVAAKKLTAKQAKVLKKVLAAKVTKFVNQVIHKLSEGTEVGVKLDLLESAATVLEITKADLQSKLHAEASVTLASLATTLKGYSQDAFIGKIVDVESAKIDAQVASNLISAEKAAELKANLVAKVTKFVTKAHGEKHNQSEHQSEHEGRAHGHKQ